MIKPIRLLLITITAVLIYSVAKVYCLEAITCFAWQCKALALQSVLGGDTQSWWLVSPLSIAWDLIWSDDSNIQTIAIAAISGAIHWVLRIAQ